jgi:hypothetical protein
MTAIRTFLVMMAAALVLAGSEQAAAQDNVDFVEVIKVFGRDDGTPEPMPYEFEACVGGPGVTGATVTVPGNPTPMPLSSQGPNEFCIQPTFTSAALLDAQFPNGTYTFDITTFDGMDSKSVDFTASETEGYLEITAPMADATGVPADSDLSVAWTMMEEVPGCPAKGGDCGDGILLFLVDESSFEDVVEELLPIGDTGFLVDAAILQANTDYSVEAGTYNGMINPFATTDGGDSIELVATWEDINAIAFTTAADIEFIEVLKAHVRDDGIPEPTPYEFEACVGGPGVTGATVTVPGNPTPITLTGGFGDFCVSPTPTFTSAALLDAQFPNGTYIFDITTVDGADSKSVSFTASETKGYLDITAPAADAIGVPADSDLSTAWTLTERVAGCIAGGDCGDGILLFLVDESQFGDDVVEEQLGIGATGFLVDADIVEGATDYSVEAGTYNGLIDPSAATDGGDPIELVATWEDINATDPMEPYEFEACVGDGGGVTGATITLPDTVTQHTLMQDPEDDGFCFFQGFGTANDLDTAFPNGSYTFDITTVDGMDSRAVSFTFSEPKGYLAFTAPTDGASVPDDSDLSVTWTLTEKVAGCVSGGDCGDGILFFLFDEETDEDLVTQLLMIDAPGTTVLAADLQPNTDYSLELETYNGTIDLSGAQTTVGGDPIELVSIWEDINSIHVTTVVPEPGAVLLQLSAFATLGWLARRRRSRR